MEHNDRELFIESLRSRAPQNEAPAEPYGPTFIEIRLTLAPAAFSGASDIGAFNAQLGEYIRGSVRKYGGVGVPALVRMNGQPTWWSEPVSSRIKSVSGSIRIVSHEECAGCGSLDHRTCEARVGAWFPPVDKPAPAAPEAPSHLKIALPTIPRNLPQVFADYVSGQTLAGLFATIEVNRVDDGLPVVVVFNDYEAVRVDARLPATFSFAAPFKVTLGYGPILAQAQVHVPVPEVRTPVAAAV